MLSMPMSWIHQGGIFFLFLLVVTVSGMDPGSSSMSVQLSMLGSQLSTLGSQLIQLQEQVEVLQQEHIQDKERLERRVSLLESVCGSTEMETEIPGSLMAIGGSTNDDFLRSAEVVNTSCDFPLPEERYGHISVTTADGKTLVCGGSRTASCLQFNPESKTWEHHSSMKFERHFPSTIVLSSGLYVLGGDNAASSSEFLATGSSVWGKGPDIPGHGEGAYQGCAAKLSDSEFVILGGEDPTQARVYNELTGRWREWPRLTEWVYAHSCVGLGDTVLMAGGYSNGADTGRTVLFDSKTGSAREVASLKYPRYYAAMGVYRGKPVILGGTDGSVKRSDGEIWNMDTETWEEADIELNIARSEFSLVTMAEEIDCD